MNQTAEELEKPGVRLMIIGGQNVAVAEKSICLMKKLDKRRCAKYMQNSCVPVKEFGGIFKPIAIQFTGYLSTIKDNKLKKLCLPIMVPQGFGLPEGPDPEADSIIVVGDHKWNGAIICADIAAETCRDYDFEQSHNGDIMGKGVARVNGTRFFVLDAPDLLRREGFLAMV